MNALAKNEKVYLIGFSGSGKSTIGPILARLLKTRFIDTDSIIERQFGVSVTRIFAERGEKDFRAMETETIKKLAARPGRAVAALGGGALASRANRKLIAGSGPVVYLSCAQSELYRRLKDKTDRPLMRSATTRSPGRAGDLKHRIAALLEKRLPIYRTADITCSTTNGTPAQSARQIAARLRKRHEQYK